MKPFFRRLGWLIQRRRREADLQQNSSSTSMRKPNSVQPKDWRTTRR